jgi:hypothetical protein
MGNDTTPSRAQSARDGAKSIFKNVKYNEKEIILNKNLINRIGERMMNIRSNKMSNKLTKPHYLFTTGYYEKNLPAQIKH